MSEKIIQNLKRIISNELDVNISIKEIDENAPLFEDGLGLDSVVIVEFITLIEEHFGFEFLENELTMKRFKNLRTVAKIISEHKCHNQQMVAEF